MRSGQGGKGGKAGNATAIAKYVGITAKGNGGNGALGGWNTTSLTDAISISEASKYDVTIGTLGTAGSTGTSKEEPVVERQHLEQVEQVVRVEHLLLHFLMIMLQPYSLILVVDQVDQEGTQLKQNQMVNMVLLAVSKEIILASSQSSHTNRTLLMEGIIIQISHPILLLVLFK